MENTDIKTLQCTVSHRKRLRPIQMLVVPGSYKNYQYGALNNQLTVVRLIWGGAVKLLMCDRKGALYSMHTTVQYYSVTT
jgi:hypothetical protein